MSAPLTFATTLTALSALADERGDTINLTLQSWYAAATTYSSRCGDRIETETVPGHRYGIEVRVWSSRDQRHYTAPTFELALRCYTERVEQWRDLVERDRGDSAIAGGDEIPTVRS